MDEIPLRIPDVLLTILVTLLASSGFWAVIAQRLAYRKKENVQAALRTDLLRGLAHDRIVYLGMKYIHRGWITSDEFENLNDYLYKPYTAMDGNGSARRVMDEVKTLPIRRPDYQSTRK